MAKILTFAIMKHPNSLCKYPHKQKDVAFAKECLIIRNIQNLYTTVLAYLVHKKYAN